MKLDRPFVESAQNLPLTGQNLLVTRQLNAIGTLRLVLAASFLFVKRHRQFIAAHYFAECFNAKKFGPTFSRKAAWPELREHFA